MITYDYLENQTLEQINVLGTDGWEVSGLIVNTSPSSFNVFVKKGFQEKTLVENGSAFFFDKTINIGDAMILTFITLAFFIMVGILVFKFIFRRE